jgi:hypothetical protein
MLGHGLARVLSRMSLGILEASKERRGRGVSETDRPRARAARLSRLRLRLPKCNWLVADDATFLPDPQADGPEDPRA